MHRASHWRAQVWVKTTEFKGGAEGGPPLATNHDVKAVEYFIKWVVACRILFAYSLRLARVSVR
jgi:hypothetical protein